MRTYTISEAAELTGMSRKAIARRVERGSLRSVVRNGRRRIPRSELVRSGLLADASQTTPGSNPRDLLLPRPVDDDELELGVSRPEDVFAALFRELLDRLERQSTEIAQFRALTVQAESLRLTNELGDLRMRIGELERERPQGEHPPQSVEFSSRISELSKQVEELSKREIWLPPHAETGQRVPAAAPARSGAQTQAAALRPPATVGHAHSGRERRGGRALRFLLEAGFLVVVALVAWQAQFRPAAIAVSMAVAWVIVAVVEWLGSRRAARPDLSTPGRRRGFG